ncbi:MAG TPA: hypothetical protein VJB87_00120 [Candidatus Nanoarchaeia archaeon]|nr:hypothetical protein [Candidatus Nanoarchaeia archaeon]
MQERLQDYTRRPASRRDPRLPLQQLQTLETALQKNWEEDLALVVIKRRTTLESTQILRLGLLTTLPRDITLTPKDVYLPTEWTLPRDITLTPKSVYLPTECYSEHPQSSFGRTFKRQGAIILNQYLAQSLGASMPISIELGETVRVIIGEQTINRYLHDITTANYFIKRTQNDAIVITTLPLPSHYHVPQYHHLFTDIGRAVPQLT